MNDEHILFSSIMRIPFAFVIILGLVLFVGAACGTASPSLPGVNSASKEIVQPDGSIILNDGTIVLPDGTQEKPDGTTVKPDGTVLDVNGNPVSKQTVENKNASVPANSDPDGIDANLTL